MYCNTMKLNITKIFSQYKYKLWPKTKNELENMKFSSYEDDVSSITCILLCMYFTYSAAQVFRKIALGESAKKYNPMSAKSQVMRAIALAYIHISLAAVRFRCTSSG